MDLFIVCVHTLSPSVVSDSFATLWTVAHQAPLSMEFARQEYWSGVPSPSPYVMLSLLKYLKVNYRLYNISQIIFLSVRAKFLNIKELE